MQSNFKINHSSVKGDNDDFSQKEKSAKKHPLSITDLGTISISETDILMKHFVKLRTEDKIPDLLLLLSHQPVLSLGARKLNSNDLLKPLDFFEKKGLSIFKSIRGGGLTYHWPGQLIVYPIMKLRKEEQHLSKYMYKLEEVGLRTLADFGIQGERKRDETAQIGLWHNQNKIASMGISVSKWVTSYGFALNLCGDIELSKSIRPCGLDVKLTTIENVTGNAPEREFVSQRVLYHFKQIFNRIEDNSLSNANLFALKQDL